MALPAPIQRPSRLVSDPADVTERLKDFGMTVEMITRSIEVGDAARRRVKFPYYPATYSGVTMWAETLAELRRQLLTARSGYEIGRTGNYENVYCADRKVAFAVNAGDGNTGIEGRRDPRLTRPKGAKTAERVERNTRMVQLALIDMPVPDLPADEACETWFLLLRPTETEIRLELSCPRRIGLDGIVDGWHERILLPAVPIAGAVEPVEPDDDGGDDGTADVLVRR